MCAPKLWFEQMIGQFLVAKSFLDELVEKDWLGVGHGHAQENDGALVGANTSKLLKGGNQWVVKMIAVGQVAANDQVKVCGLLL